MNFYQFLIPRLNGWEIESSFNYYLGLVKKGIGGFIVFGGKLASVKEGISRLQREATFPLLIASDLEQGLGQQIEGGTLFPPAMAMSEAAQKDPDSVRQAFKHLALEASYSGINTVLAPVLDINVNPDNPIICTRAFCDNPQRVASIGIQMIQAIQSTGVMACGKHFPGHGATEIDSHIALPMLTRTMEELESFELVPFRAAVSAGVEMLMPGHLSVPALDPSGAPMTVSSKGISYIRENLRFQGMIITDAMNMGGIVGQQPGPSYLALKAGVDYILHPDDPDQVVSMLNGSDLRITDKRISTFRNRLAPPSSSQQPESAQELSDNLAKLALKLEGPSHPLKDPFVITISDESEPQGHAFISALGASGHFHLTPKEPDRQVQVPEDREVIVAVFSEPKAWKGETSEWIRSKVRELIIHSHLFIAFGDPYTLREVRLDEVRKGATKGYAYWASEPAQLAMAEKLMSDGKS